MAEKSEKKCEEKMKDELTKMLDNSQHKKAPEMKNTHEIEADLKRMLNMQPSTARSNDHAGKQGEDKCDSQLNENSAENMGNQDAQSASAPATGASRGVVVTMDDLHNLTSCKPNSRSSHNSGNAMKSAHVKKKKKGKHSEEDERPAVHHHHGEHVEDPPVTVAVNADDESQVAVPKKKKRKKNKKSKKRDKDDSLVGAANDQDMTESDDSEEEMVVKVTVPEHRILEFRRTKYLDDKLTPEVLMELEEERIYPLKKKSSAFANAKYFCRLCDYHCDSIPISRHHAEDARHRRRKEIMVQDKMLKNLPTPSARHVAALDALIEKINLVHGLTDDELSYRIQMARRIQADLNESISGVELRPFGSSVSGFGLKDADLNMDLVGPKGVIPARYLVQVLRKLSEMPEYKNVRSDFLAKVPAVLFTSPCGTLHCQITIGCELSCYTSQYLSIYAKLDDRLRKLAVAFKYWAKICQLDKQEAGSLPAYCYGILTVYFLQQIKHPVLPVFWKDMSEAALKRPQCTDDIMNLLSDFRQLTWKTQNTDSVGCLWKDLLMFYGLHFSIADHAVSIRSKKLLSRSEKKWKSKRMAIEDPFFSKRNVARSLQNLTMFDYFFNCLRKAGLYFSLPSSHQDVLKYNKSKKKDVPDWKHKKGQQKQASNQVFSNTNLKERSTTTSRATSESEPAERVSVGEEGSVSTIVIENSSHNQLSVEDAPKFCEQSVMPVSEGQIANKVLNSDAKKHDEKQFAMEFVEKVISDAVVAVREMSIKEKNESHVTNKKMNRAQDNEECQQSENDRLASCSESSSASEDDNGNDESEFNQTSDGRPEVASPVGAEYDYKFDSQTLTDGKGPSVICCVCDKEGHLKTNCPEDELPKIIELPHLPKSYLQMLSGVIKQVPKDFRLSSREIAERESIRRDLEVHIQNLYPGAQLELFGSSKNGFGFHHSDLDICVTFKGKKAEEINFVEHIEAICKKLKAHRGLYGVFPITTAKVPIVKFVHRPAQLEGDISMYNVLAMQNTKLLLAYASIDPRVQTLGYAIKVFAKVCDIGDASRGSLSSYAYMLMMLHYLQHTKPPLIPVLQELRYPDNPNPEYMVEGWNTWFFDNFEDLPNIWPGLGKNSQSVGELWLGFFRYYLEEFSFLEQVVTIRQFQPLLKFEKLWNGKCIAIEDPFDLDHNLGGALSRRMNQYIQRTVVHARELYGKPLDKLPEGFNKIEDYFFDKGQLVEGDPPSDRLCRVCSKIGHIAKECPVLIARKEREAAERKRREEMKKQEGTTPGRNSGPRHHNHHSSERQGNLRSLSDPSSEDSPGRGSNRGHVYQRQHSQPSSQSPDKRQIPALRDLRFDAYNQANYGSPRSPHHDYQQSYSPNRRQQSHPIPRSPQSKNPPDYGYRQQQVYSNQHYQYKNRNENSRPMYSQGQGQAANRNGPQYTTNQNYDLRQQRNYIQGDNHNYPTSPSHNQPQPAFKNNPSQVYIDPNMFGGHQRCLLTNPVLNSPVNVMPSVPLFVNTSMAAGQAFPLAATPLVTIPSPGVNFDNQPNSRPPVCMPDWYNTQLQASVGSSQIPLVRHNSSIQTEVNLNPEHFIWTTVGQSGHRVESVNNPGRTVNVQKTGRNQAVSDFGITVNNEYYENREK